MQTISDLQYVYILAQVVMISVVNVFKKCLHNIYISHYDVSVCLSVRLSVTEVQRIIANLGFKFRSHFTAHCGRRVARHAACGRRAACGRIISRHAS